MKYLIIIITLITSHMCTAQKLLNPYPVIDMHLHSDWWKEGAIEPFTQTKSNVKNAQALEDSTFQYIRQYNIVKAVTDGSFALKYQKRAPDVIIPARSSYHDSIDSLRKWFASSRYRVMAEFKPQYEGLKPGDEELNKFFKLAEELDVPIGIHMGLGPTGAAYIGYKDYRMSHSNPLFLEEVLIQYPKARVYVMHAGWPFIDELIGLLYAHPQVYVDIAVINWILPQKEFHNYLRRIVEAGFADRVMYGSDQMQWPQTIKLSIGNILAADFLTSKQKEDIFYNNAARFLRLPKEEILRHKSKE